MQLAVGDGALVHPGPEDRGDGRPQLGFRILREVLAGLLAHHLLELADDLLPILGRQFGVEAETLVLLGQLQDFLEVVVVDV